jgi:ABC-type sugar transport system permease subunit
MEVAMSTTSAGTYEPDALPIPPWALPTLVVAAVLFWVVTMEGGMVSHALGQTGMFLHELFHDGRHLLGVPCH